MIERLLEIQNYTATSVRPFDWAHRTTCLQIANEANWNTALGPKPDLQEVTVDILHADPRYIAVSYRNKRGKNEPKIDRVYTIQRKESVERGTNKARAYVFQRVISFSLHHCIDKLWIDEDCLDEQDKIEAINGMDIVYRKATKCVGLLTIALHTEDDACVLDSFLSGEFTVLQGKHNQAGLNPQLDKRQFRKLCHLLRRVYSDRWWTRCWTFQEAYCGGGKMMLLVPYQPSHSTTLRLQHLQSVGQDFQFRLRDLQEQTTLLSLAIDHHERQSPRTWWTTLKPMLKAGRRYGTIHEHGTTKRARFSKTPMSASIIADICRGDLFEKTDLPAVIANCCDYTQRVTIPSSPPEKLSLSLVILVLFLRNGDFLKVNSRTKPHVTKTICEILCDTSFRQTIKPEAANQLTLLKRRRWPKVQLCRNFIRTWGHIWTVDQYLRVRARKATCNQIGWKAKSINDFEKDCLERLIARLRPKYLSLVSHLQCLLQDLSEAVHDITPRKRWILSMVREVCRAMVRGLPLLLGKPSDEGQYRAIFVSPALPIRRNMTVLTSWEAGKVIDEAQNLRTVEKYVSFRAQPVVSSICKDNLWTLKDWLNGLCFYERLPQQEILFPWPDFLD